MGERMLRYKLADLQTFRIRCKLCDKGTIEVSVRRLDIAVERDGRCRLCDKEVLTPRMMDQLRNLQTALENMVDHAENLDITFELPEPG